MIRFALCDDNVQLLSKLKEMLELIFFKHDFEASVVFYSDDTNKLMNFLSTNQTDVLFLDIDFHSKQNGIEIAKAIRKTNKEIYIIFITAHFEFIISAFECKTFDFIPKPFSQSKLENTVIRLFDDFTSNKSSFIKLNNKRQLINQNLVNFIQKRGMRTIYNTDNGEFDSYGSFLKLESSLPENFVRCHKSYIVNIDNIGSINLNTNIILFKNSNNKCYIGPKYKNSFMEVLNNHGNIK